MPTLPIYSKAVISKLSKRSQTVIDYYISTPRETMVIPMTTSHSRGFRNKRSVAPIQMGSHLLILSIVVISDLPWRPREYPHVLFEVELFSQDLLVGEFMVGNEQKGMNL